jgi:putative transposase
MRLKDYDYSQTGAYFVTVCTYNRAPLLGAVRDGSVQLSPVGQIAQEEWLRTPQMRRNVILDEFIFLPNHFHGILFIVEDVDDGGMPMKHLQAEPAEGALPVRKLQPPSRTIGAIMRGFKGATTARVRRIQASKVMVWQTQFHDHVIRDEDELTRIREYIVNNAKQWELDRYFLSDGG